MLASSLMVPTHETSVQSPTFRVVGVVVEHSGVSAPPSPNTDENATATPSGAGLVPRLHTRAVSVTAPAVLQIAARSVSSTVKLASNSLPSAPCTFWRKLLSPGCCQL